MNGKFIAAILIIIVVLTLQFSHISPPPHPRAMLAKHFEQTHERILLISHIEKGKRGFDMFLHLICVPTKCDKDCGVNLAGDYLPIKWGGGGG